MRKIILILGLVVYLSLVYALDENATSIDFIGITLVSFMAIYVANELMKEGKE